jgi:hypothetical protein
MSNADDLMGIEHLDHCIDMLRQGIMVCDTFFIEVLTTLRTELIIMYEQCSGDITPITFARTSLDSRMKVVAEVVHTCRDFAKIQQWAWNRRIKTELDHDTVVTNDPLGWGTFTYSP